MTPGAGEGREGRRVAVVFHNEQLNGATIAVLRTIPLLQERGWEFAFWAPGPGPAQDRLEELGYAVAGCERPIASGLQALREPPGLRSRVLATGPYMRAFARFLRRVDPDLVHSNSLYSFAEALAARALGYPTLLHLHDMAPRSRKSGIAKAICRWGVDASLAVSYACARSYALRGWQPTVVHGAAPISPEPVTIRESADPFVVGTVGVVAQRKGTDLFVAAAERLAAGDRRIEFRLIGTPSDPLDRAWGEAVLDRARAAGVGHRHSADVARELREWDAFVLPSRRDPFPLVVLEAMGMGLPVIGTSVDGIPEQLEGGAGVLVKPEDADALEAAILRVAAMRAEDRRELGAAARRRVADRFSLERLVSGTERVYHEVAQTRP